MKGGEGPFKYNIKEVANWIEESLDQKGNELK